MPDTGRQRWRGGGEGECVGLDVNEERGTAWLGAAGLGEARLGKAWPGMAGLGEARNEARHGTAWLGTAGPGEARNMARGAT